MFVYIGGKIKNLHKIDFVRFCIVGTSGFIINFALLTTLYKVIGLHVFVAQLISSEIALFNNFVLHNNWTYKNRSDKSIKRLLIQFHASSWSAILGSAVIVSVAVKTFNLNYVVALVIASAAGLFWNFAWTKFVIWRRHHEVALQEDRV
ncbi:GtrA family protein [Candidatus Saccharibacteria bacterium]|nr:GtrA family protein [Candidatus Saccharibacteria bacterium]